jgi:catechol 2,3-dioxygenase-like lactoylglutathione lyase family enzyme
MTSRFDILAIDARDPRGLAEFWCAVLGYAIVEAAGDGVRTAHDPHWGSDQPRPANVPPGIDFLPVPEGKTVKNRLHLDLRPVGVPQEEELARLLRLGARRVQVGQPDDVPWVVLADPEGNEFCLLNTPAPPG